MIREPQVEEVSEVSSCGQRRGPVRSVTKMEQSGGWRDEEGPEHGGQDEEKGWSYGRVMSAEGESKPSSTGWGGAQAIAC